MYCKENSYFQITTEEKGMEKNKLHLIAGLFSLGFLFSCTHKSAPVSYLETKREDIEYIERTKKEYTGVNEETTESKTKLSTDEVKNAYLAFVNSSTFKEIDHFFVPGALPDVYLVSLKEKEDITFEVYQNNVFVDRKRLRNRWRASKRIRFSFCLISIRLGKNPERFTFLTVIPYL